jgi:hypothetical protein
MTKSINGWRLGCGVTWICGKCFWNVYHGNVWMFSVLTRDFNEAWAMVRWFAARPAQVPERPHPLMTVSQ